MKRIGKTAAWLFVLLLLGVAILPVFADDFDIDYSGVTDDVTGEPVGGDVEPGDVRVWICGNEYYDPTEGRFVFILPTSGFAVSANVADGMVTTERVRISVPNGVDAALFRNGQKIDPSGFDDLTAPGKYVLTVSDGGKSLQLVSFTIVGSINDVEGTTVPSTVTSNQGTTIPSTVTPTQGTAVPGMTVPQPVPKKTPPPPQNPVWTRVKTGEDPLSQLAKK